MISVNHVLGQIQSKSGFKQEACYTQAIQGHMRGFCDGLDGWELFEVGAILEEELRIPINLIPLKPSIRFTKYIERYGKVIL